MVNTIQGQKRVSGWGNSPESAEADLELVIQGIQFTPATGQSFYSFTQTEYLPTVRNKSQKWREQIAWALDLYIYPAFRDFPLEEIKRPMIAKFFQGIRKRREKGKIVGLSTTSLGHVRKVLFAIFEMAVIDEIIDRNPVQHVKLTADPELEPMTKRQVLTPYEIRRLIEVTRTETLWKSEFEQDYHSAHAIAVLAGLLGLSLVEIQRREKPPKGKILEVDGRKTSARMRDVPLPAEVVKELKGTKFPICKSQSSARKAMIHAAGRAGISKPCNPHALRHAFATMLQSLGCPEDARARLLGHGKRGITAHYSHAEMESWRGWVELGVTTVYSAVGEDVGEFPEMTA